MCIRDSLESALLRIMHRLRSTGERELPSRAVGEMVMEELKEIDAVAYVRFASVYRDFQDIEEFQAEITRLTELNPNDESVAEAARRSRTDPKTK